MFDPSLCTEEEIARFVAAFYAKVRKDERLGPVFDAHVDDWDHHLAKLTDFWSSMLRGTRRYAGTPMARHAALPDLDETLFARWLELFGQTAHEQDNAAMATRAETLARRIAQSLWLGYQMQHHPDRLARDLPCA
ncbi:preprotein translocase subunit TatC [Pigmentiphaga sp. NML080357]|uniref:group III truncated hemoglobin n=1 Tax=Pigmentiphaga sp. NML080357 TaxID=2008675 RepID=UPI000B40BF54|nr:group III truncated hemoglobin [Pigmentiphaga sp. NML080357]OVZ58505.1 preprotein translocase subunit TatC [Pigmentiphaga sp. NML080357]